MLKMEADIRSAEDLCFLASLYLSQDIKEACSEEAIIRLKKMDSARIERFYSANSTHLDEVEKKLEELCNKDPTFIWLYMILLKAKSSSVSKKQIKKPRKSAKASKSELLRKFWESVIEECGDLCSTFDHYILQMYLLSDQSFNASGVVTISPGLIDYGTFGNSDKVKFTESSNQLKRQLLPGLSLVLTQSEEEFKKALNDIKEHTQQSSDTASKAENQAIARFLQPHLSLVSKDLEMKIPLRRNNSWLKDPKNDFITSRRDLLTSDALCRSVFGEFLSHVKLECETTKFHDFKYHLGYTKGSKGFSSLFDHFTETLIETTKPGYRQPRVGIPLVLGVTAKSKSKCKSAAGSSSEVGTED